MKVQSTDFLFWIIQGIGVGTLVSILFLFLKMVINFFTSALQTSAVDDVEY